MKRKGFTLVELLVVISIIAVLLSILMPSLRKAKEQAKKVVCMSNLKQMGLGHLLYAEDWNGWQIYVGGDDTVIPNTNWYGQLFPKYIPSPKSFECSTSLSDSVDSRWVDRKVIDGPHVNIGYGYAYQNPTNGFQYLPDKLLDIVRPAEKILLADSYGNELFLGMYAYAVTGAGTLRTLSGRHNNGANVLHFDGHVGWYKKDYLNIGGGGYYMWRRYE